MTHVFRTLSLAAVFAGLIATPLVASALQVGQQLTPAEQAALGTGTRHTVAGATLRTFAGVSARSTDGANATTVVDARGVVGTSRNEVLVSRVPTATVRALAPALTQARTTDYYDHMQMTSLRYATFADAVAARERLQAALPAAQVTLPIQYQARKPR